MNMVESPDILLHVKNLNLSFYNPSGPINVLRGISFIIKRGKSLGLLGDSGSGKSVSVLGMLDLLPAYVKKDLTGEAYFHPQNEEPVNLIGLSEKFLNKIRGQKIAMIFQDPMNALNPIQKCGKQIRESVEVNLGMGRKASTERALELLQQVGLEDIERIYHSYPHELSGGQLQRVVIAMALGGEPELLIADEPTTNLDRESKESILELLSSLKLSHGLTLLYITHDFSEAQRMSDEICVLSEGKVSSQATSSHVELQRNQFAALRARNVSKDGAQSLVKIRNLTKSFRRQSFMGFKDQTVPVFKDLNFDILANSVTGLVGRSGSGKTTLGRVILNLEKPDAGSVIFRGHDLFGVSKIKMRQLRQKLQIVYQNPYNTLNPRMKIRNIVAEPIRIHNLRDDNSNRNEMAIELLEKVGIAPSKHDHYMYQLSGGQRQRVAIARSLIMQPEFVVLDECISSLDVKTQNRIIDLLLQLQEDFSLGYLFISHDENVVSAVSNNVFELSEGRLHQLL
jgi:ABC-type microcin C transport system duplicated ATPase subunit YejF